MDESILTSVKKTLGIAEDYEHFDPDLILHINSVFMILQQLGVGPSEGFFINDNTQTWANYLSDNKKLEAVKTYMCLKVRLLFDPPLSSAVMTAIEHMVGELEWRLNVAAEQKEEEIQNGV